MKKTLFLLSGLMIGLSSTAQVKTPQLSPAAEIEQTVGLTEFEVEYARPSLRGRDLHKEILPYGEAWRFGANKNSTLSFNTAINFGGVDVKPGKYSMYAVPGEGEWKITLYNETSNWGLPRKWEDSKVVAEVKVPVQKNEKSVETFTISFANLNINHFDLVVEWEHTVLPIKVKLPTKELTIASIKKGMKGKPTEREFYDAASYYVSENIEMDDALIYVNKAIEMNGDAPFYYIHKKANILKALGKNKEAIDAAKLSLEKSKKAGNNDYVRMNEALIKELSK